MSDFQPWDYDGLKERIFGMQAMNNLDWAHVIVEDAGGRFFIHIVDSETFSMRHPSFPFPMESRTYKKAVDKAERAVKRANEIRISW